MPRDEDAVRRFVERFAVILSDAGMPRMAARVFGALVAAERRSLSAAELAEYLQVSPAAISGAVRYLTQVAMIERVREPGSRRDRYQAFTGNWYAAFTQRNRMIDNMVQSLADGRAAAGPDTGAGQRLDEIGRFFQFLSSELDSMIERWEKFNKS